MKKFIIIVIMLAESFLSASARVTATPSTTKWKKKQKATSCVEWGHADLSFEVNTKIQLFCRMITEQAKKQLTLTTDKQGRKQGNASLSTLYRSNLLGSDVLFLVDVKYVEEESKGISDRPIKKYSITLYGDQSLFVLHYDSDKKVYMYNIKFNKMQYTRKGQPSHNEIEGELTSAIDKILTRPIILKNN